MLNTGGRRDLRARHHVMTRRPSPDPGRQSGEGRRPQVPPVKRKQASTLDAFSYTALLVFFLEPRTLRLKNEYRGNFDVTVATLLF